MKAVFVGGGSLRLLGILRGALAGNGIFNGGSIHLHDLNVHRAEAMGRMLMKTPEFKASGCKLSWGSDLEPALPGADMVGVILRAGSMLNFELGTEASFKLGFDSSDNISPNGAFLALKGGPIIMDIARKMERLCPEALLVDFANPVAVLSGMVNNHTKIKALGVCAGYTNHMWDLSRVIFGKDEQSEAFDVEAAGVNHISYIVKGTAAGKEIFKAMDEALANPKWAPPKLQPFWSAAAKANIRNSVRNIARFYRELGVVIFSTEPDGMQHLDYEGILAKKLKEWKPRSKSAIEAQLKKDAEGRRKTDAEFQQWLSRDTDEKFWNEHWKTGDLVFRREDNDIFVKIMKALAGAGSYKVAVSRPNDGAVAGFKDRDVLEYSQIIDGKTIKPAGKYAVPDVVQGLTAALSSHQTMLGDAMASDDPRLLARALMAYPVRQYSMTARRLYKELAKINKDELQPGLRSVADYL